MYERWLTSAYRYYWGTGLESEMSDAEWDHVAKQVAQDAEQYEELRGKNYTGGSLFWLPKEAYPSWATGE